MPIPTSRLTPRIGHVLLAGAMALACVVARATPARGEPVGSPTHLEKGQWDMELRGGGVHQRSMKGGATVSIYGGGHRRGYGLTDRLSLYGEVGAASVTVEDGAFPKGISQEFGTNLLVDLQVKGILWQNARKDWTWDGSLQYIFIGSPHKRGKNKASWNEWQFATCLAKSFGAFKPYAGVKASLVSFGYTARGNQIQIDGTYKPDGTVGPVFGLDWTFGENQDAILNVETSYVNGPDIALTLTKRF